MGRPKGSKNKPKTTRPVMGNPIATEGTNVPSRSDTSPAQDDVATAETLAPGYPAQGGAPTPPAVFDTVTHPDGRTGEVTEVEARGSGYAVCVRWSGDDDESQYTPIDWRELQAALVAAHAPTEPAPATPDEPRAPETTYDDDDEPQPPPGMTARLLDLLDEITDTDRQLVDKESEKKTVVDSYNKSINILSSRRSQLIADAREAQWPETYDYKKGLKHIWNGRSGKLERTEELGSYQVPLDLDHPAKPPAPEVTETPADPPETPAEVVVECNPFDDVPAEA